MERYQSLPAHDEALYVPIDPSTLQSPINPEQPMIILEKAKTPFFVEKASYFADRTGAFTDLSQEALGRLLDTEL